MTAAGRKAISQAQKARWAKVKAAKANNKSVQRTDEENFHYQPTPKAYAAVFAFLTERMKVYDSTMEAFVDGYMQGFHDANVSKQK